MKVENERKYPLVNAQDRNTVLDQNHFLLSPKLKAAFRHASNISDSLYLKSIAVLLVSPLQNYYNNQEKFTALIDLINHKNFKEIWIVIGDTNNQHNLMANGKTQAAAFAIAKAQGDQWVHKYSGYLNQVTVPYKLSRWLEWRSKPEYIEYRAVLNEYYANHPQFRFGFLETAHEFLSRQDREQHIPKALKQRYLSCSLEYLKEECSIIMPMWAALGVNFIIYPTEISAALQKSHEAFVKPNYQDVRTHWLSLRFKRLKEKTL